MLEPHVGIEAETQYRIQRQLSRRTRMADALDD